MNELFAILASAGIVFLAIYIVAKVFNIKLTSRNDYWDGFIDGYILGDDDCND
jgi:hypothetical protein